MNSFISVLFDRLRAKGIHSLLVKGQGIALCYEKPLWRACGDVDLLLDKSNYEMAKHLFQEISDKVVEESQRRKDRLHSEYYIKDWIVELHGSLHACLSNRMDRVLDEIQQETFSMNAYRVWQNDKTHIYLPEPNNDVIFVFAHILQHLFMTGIGLRQICDLIRLLWTFRDKIDRDKLYARLSRMCVVSEWKVFGCLMVNYLGMPENTMPFYDSSYCRKAQMILSYIMKTGNFGQNRDKSHLAIEQSFVRKVIISWNHLKDCIKLSRVFPIDAPRFFCRFMIDGIAAAVRW